VAVIAVLTAVVTLSVRSQSLARSEAGRTLAAAVEAARRLDTAAHERAGTDAALIAEALRLAGSDPDRAEPLLRQLPSRDASLWLLCDAKGAVVAQVGRRALKDASLCSERPSPPLRTLASLPVEVVSIDLPGELPDSTARRLVVVEELDLGRLQSLAHQVRAEVVVVAGGQVLGGTLPAEAAQAVAQRLPTLASGPHEIELDGRDFWVQLLPVREGSQEGRVFLAGIDSMAPALAGWVGNAALAVLGGLILGLPLSWAIHRRFHRSLDRLVDSMARAAQGAELDLQPQPIEDAGPEVRRLDHAFRALTANFVASQRDRERSYVEAIGAVVAAIDARDHETTGHSFRVAHYALALARAMAIEGGPLRAIEWGSLLHDVGKIAVPDAILRKPDRLSEEEWFVMRQHPNWGFEMLADVKFLEPALEIVYSHHERWDGSGYPRGLEGEEIPLGARIFAVVDTYDSITSDRPYRRSRGHAEAVTELCRVAGSQLDPEVVEAFIRIPEAEIRRLRELSEELDLRVRIPRALVEGGELRARVSG
jgi:putative nucleotidyltransferase with HDIG domain